MPILWLYIVVLLCTTLISPCIALILPQYRFFFPTSYFILSLYKVVLGQYYGYTGLYRIVHSRFWTNTALVQAFVYKFCSILSLYKVVLCQYYSCTALYCPNITLIPPQFLFYIMFYLIPI